LHPILTAGAIAAAVTAIIVLLRTLWRIGVALHDFLEPLSDLVHHELRPNGGSSIVDKLDYLVGWARNHDVQHGADQDELWAVLAANGIDRRRKPPDSLDAVS
jgi:hypothetical protein